MKNQTVIKNIGFILQALQTDIINNATDVDSRNSVPELGKRNNVNASSDYKFNVTRDFIINSGILNL